MLDTVELIAGGGLLDLLERLDPDSSVRIVSYTPYLTRKGDDFTLRTAEIVLSGGFVPLLRILDATERELSGCRLLSSVQDAPAGTADLAAVDPRCPATDR
jgi:hypothetical protein